MFEVIIQVLFLVMFVVMMFYGQKIQAMNLAMQLEMQVLKLKRMRNKARSRLADAFIEAGVGDKYISRVAYLAEEVLLMPSSIDPFDLVTKMDSILSTREQKWIDELLKIVPKATEEQRQNLENLIEIVQSINLLYRVLRHYFLIGKKRCDYLILMQVSMIMPQIAEYIIALSSAMETMEKGAPIGDGVGALVACKMMKGYDSTEIVKNTVVAEVPLEGRTLFVVKAKGTGGTTGHVGKALNKILTGEKIKLIIMVDAGLKFEGDRKGEVVEGVGTAIGGYGVERFQIEEGATRWEVPIYCFIIKEGFKEAISAIQKEVVIACDEVIKRIKRVILEKTEENDKVVIIGVGNTMGIGQ